MKLDLTRVFGSPRGVSMKIRVVLRPYTGVGAIAGPWLSTVLVGGTEFVLLSKATADMQGGEHVGEMTYTPVPQIRVLAGTHNPSTVIHEWMEAVLMEMGLQGKVEHQAISAVSSLLVQLLGQLGVSLEIEHEPESSR